jgi:16S rRNA (uracil1498-N3)-methyltransferase
MRRTRIHVIEPLAAASEFVLPEQAATHLTRVLRLKPGAMLTLFDGRGGEYAAELSSIEREGVRVRVLSHTPIERESPLAITLLQGIARGERMDLVVQKATELGVTTVVPLLTERAVVQLDAKQRERKRSHWQAIAIAACEQCGRNRVPTIALPTELGTALTQQDASSANWLLAAESTAALAALTPAITAARLLVGPEGGLAPIEIAHAERAGFSAVRLGPRVLRTETAGLAAIVSLQCLAGDFRA